MNDDLGTAPIYIAGQTSLIIGMAPTADCEFVILLGVEDPDHGQVFVSLGTQENLTSLMESFIRTQNLLTEAEDQCEAQSALSASERLDVLTRLSDTKYPQTFFNESDD
jgi:hypothetical protein